MTIYDATAAIIPPAERARLGMVYLPTCRPQLGEVPPASGAYFVDIEEDDKHFVSLFFRGLQSVAPQLDRIVAWLQGCRRVNPLGECHWIGPYTNDSWWFEQGARENLANPASAALTIEASMQLLTVRGVSALVDVVGVYGYADPREGVAVYQSRVERWLRYAQKMGRRMALWMTPWATGGTKQWAGREIPKSYHEVAIAAAQKLGADVVVWAVTDPSVIAAEEVWFDAAEPKGPKPMHANATWAQLRATSLWSAVQSASENKETH